MEITIIVGFFKKHGIVRGVEIVYLSVCLAVEVVKNKDESKSKKYIKIES
jgi:hypothetical protein